MLWSIDFPQVFTSKLTPNGSGIIAAHSFISTAERTLGPDV